MTEKIGKRINSKIVVIALVITAIFTFFGLFAKTNVTYASTVIGTNAESKYSQTGFSQSYSVSITICKKSASGTTTTSWGKYTWSGATEADSRFAVAANSTFTFTSSGFPNPERVAYSRVLIGKTTNACSFTLSVSFGSKSDSVSGTTSTSDSIEWFPDLYGGGGTSVTWTLKNNSGSPLAFSSGFMEVQYGREFTVNFDTNGGSGGTSSTKLAYWGPYSNISVPSRSGYNFKGYFDAKTGGTKYYNANGSPAKTTWDKKAETWDSAVTLYAQWEVAEQAVSVTKGTGVKSVYLSTTNTATSGSASGSKFNSGSTVYAFAELAKGYSAPSTWTKVSGTANAEGAKYRVSSKTVGTSAVNFGTINATATSYTLTYTLNGGSVTGNPTSYTINSNTFTLKNPTRTGYTFTGWSGTDITNTSTSVSVTKGSIGNRSYAANWSADSYTIAFDKNATDATGTTDSVTATYDATKDLPATGFSRVGYDFAGWATSSTGEVAFADAATLTKDQVNTLYNTANKNGTYTLFANWKYVEEIQDVVDKIKAIGTVEYTNSCKTKIETAEAAYDALSGTYKNIIPEYYEILTKARADYDRAGLVNDLIDAITPFEITAECKDKIDAARKAYDESSEFVQSIVPNYNDLTKKEVEYANAYNTIQLINAIGTVKYPDSEDEINAARAAYNALTKEEKDLVGFNNLTTLAAAEGYYNSVRDNAFADDVIEKIKAIAPLAVTDLCKSKIDTARAAYDALENDDQKELVYNYEDLTKAEADYAAAKAIVDLIKAIGDVIPGDVCQGKIDAARTAYDKLEADQKALVYNYSDLTDREAAKPVVDKIAEITSVDPSKECQDKIDATRTAFNALSEEQQELVLNEQNLIDAEKAKPVSDLIEAIKPVEPTTECKGRIDTARTEFNKLTNAQVALISNKDDLVDIEAAKVVVDKIAAIGDIDDTDACQTKVTDARTAYAALTKKQQALVSNYGDLTDREAAKAAVEKIQAIGTVEYTKDCKDKIDAARKAFDDLSDNQEVLVPEASVKALEDAEAAYKDLDDASKANKVVLLIKAIGTVEYTDTCKTKIDTAREAYDELENDEQRNLVYNYSTLTDDEALYNAVDGAVKAIDAIGEVKYPDSKEAIETARTTYDNLTEAQTALVPAAKVTVLEAAEAKYIELEDLFLANRVKELIDAIGKVTLSEECKGRIEAARTAYDDLNDRQRKIVGYEYFTKLVAAEGYFEAEWDNFCADKVRKLIIAISPLEISDECKARIDAARAAYDDEKFTDEQRLLVTNYADLEKAETDYAAAKVVVDLIEQLPETVLTARTKYDALTVDQKALVYNYNKLLLAEATKADTLIDAIGTVEYTKDCKDKIDAARAEYESLNDEQKAVVKKLDVLEAAEYDYAELKTTAISDAIEKIGAIGTVEYTKDCKDKIDAARSAFDAVLEADQASVTNKQTLLDAEAAYAALKADHEAAEAVDTKINAIGTVAYTAECKALIDAARTAYDALTPTQNGYVTKLATLEAAESLYNAVDNVATKINAIPSPLTIAEGTATAITTARTAYDALTPAQKALVTAELLAKLVDNEKAYPVMGTIEAIKPFELKDECKTRIDAARAAFDKLTEAQKTLVANKADLEKAEADYNAFIDQAKADDVKALINAIGTVAYTADCKAAIDAANTAYGKLTETQQALVSNYATLTSATNRYTAVDNAVKAIDAIGTVELTKECEGKIGTAFEAYIALSSDIDLLPAASKKAFEDKSGAYSTMQKIAAIGTLEYTKTCKDKISDAYEIYELLSNEGKALVTNYQTLADAIAILQHIDAVVAKIDAIPTPLVIDTDVKAAINDARAAYDEGLTEKENALFPAEKLELLVNIEVAYNVMKQINVIPTQITLTDSGCLEKIANARAAYDYEEVTDDQRKLVTNYQKLLDAEVVVADLKIDAIGTVAYTDACKALIDAAREAFDALTDAQKAASKSAADLTTAETTYATLRTAAINDTITKIDAIGTVAYTADSLALINAADAAWDKILAADAELVTNLAVLEKAINDYNALSIAAVNDYNNKIEAIGTVAYTKDCKDKIDAARAAYNALVGEDKTGVTNLSTLTTAENSYNTLKTTAISNAITNIDAIGTVAYTDTCKAKIDAARTAYDAVLAADQDSVTNKQKLIDAENLYAKLKADKEAADAAIEKINAIGEVKYPDSKEAIEAARKAYNGLTDAQKDLVNADTLKVLTDAESLYAKLKADQDAADAVVAKIEAIGEVTYTPESKAKIDAAYEAYEALTPEQKALVDQDALDMLAVANDEYEELKTNHEAAADATDKINAIGQVEYTTASKNKIDAARKAYDDLTSAQKGLVDANTLKVLTDAEAAYAALKADHEAAEAAEAKIEAIGTVTYTADSKAKIDAARKAYNALTADQKALVKDADKQALLDAEAAYDKLEADNIAAKAVADKIAAIGTVTYTADSKAKIDAARKAYDALTNDQKALVKDVNTLTGAEAAYKKLEADNTAAKAVADKIAAIGTVAYTADSKAKIDAARKAYDALTNDQKALVKDVNTLTGAEAAYKKLEADNKAAANAQAKIDAIGKVAYNAQTKARIDAARTAYNALTPEQKALVKDTNTLTNAEKTYSDVEEAYAKINAITTISLSEASKQEIDDARKAYESLSDEEKALVPNYSKLTSSETQYNKLVEEKKTGTMWTYIVIGAGALALVGIVVYVVLFKKKEDKE